MNKLIKSLLVVAGVALAGSASAVTPVQKAGLCAGNAIKIKQVATEVLASKNSPAWTDLSKQASGQVAYFQTKFGNQPGFKEAAAYSYNQPSTLEDRLRMIDNCAGQGI